MTMYAYEILAAVAQMCQEDSSFSSGLWTTTELLRYLQDTERDFLQRTGVHKRFGSLKGTVATRIYSVPDDCMHLHRVAFAERPLHHADRRAFDRQEPDWRTKTGYPKGYHRDQLPRTQFETDRAVTAGMLVQDYTGTPAPAYGTLRTMSGSLTYTGILPAAGSGGTLRTILGTRAYNVTPSPPYGVLRTMLHGPTSFEILYTLKGNDMTNTLAEMTVPDWCQVYMAYGVMRRMYEKQGEAQDVAKAQYCLVRYQQGITQVRKLMGLTTPPPPEKANG